MYSFRKNEIDKALSTGKPVIGPRGKLLQEDRPDVYALSLIHPGYNTSVDGDLNRWDGISKIVVRMPDLIEQAARDSLSAATAVYIFDESPHRTQQVGGEPIFLAGAHVETLRNGTVQMDLRPETDFDKVRGNGLFYTSTIRASDHVWRVAVYPLDGRYDPYIGFIVLGGSIIAGACLILAIAFHCNLQRIAKMNMAVSNAESEKAQLALDQAKREAHLNGMGLNRWVANCL